MVNRSITITAKTKLDVLYPQSTINARHFLNLRCWHGYEFKNFVSQLHGFTFRSSLIAGRLKHVSNYDLE